jgi:hypothetical protein
VLVAKEVRRVHLGEHFTLLFENRLTVRYQIQEMMRVERIVREADVQHEIDTYNELLGGPGELGCTLLIEIDDADERAAKLAKWHGLPARFYLALPDGRRVYARMDAARRTSGESRPCTTSNSIRAAPPRWARASISRSGDVRRPGRAAAGRVARRSARRYMRRIVRTIILSLVLLTIPLRAGARVDDAGPLTGCPAGTYRFLVAGDPKLREIDVRDGSAAVVPGCRPSKVQFTVGERGSSLLAEWPSCEAARST